MSINAQKYRLAAQAYRVAKNQDGEMPEDEADFYRFTNHPDWPSVLLLLSASGLSINVGFVRTGHGTEELFLGSEGFYFTKESRTDYVIFEKTFYREVDRKFPAHLFAEAFRNKHKDISFMDFIHQELGRIVDQAPKG